MCLGIPIGQTVLYNYVAARAKLSVHAFAKSKPQTNKTVQKISLLMSKNMNYPLYYTTEIITLLKFDSSMVIING